MTLKPLGINTSTFSKLIEDGCVYVDKTETIYNLVSSAERNYFLSRPRRFGKSLLVSTFESLFLGNKHLFKDCWIGKSDYDFKPYHVISFDFSTISQATAQEFKESLLGRIQLIAKSYDINLQSNKLAQEALFILVTELAKSRPVVILIDEYDAPILRHIHELEKAFAMQDVLRDFFKTIKGLDQYLRFLFLTGVSKFSQTSVFSGLNNLQDLTMSPTGATLLGYTEQEIHTYFGDRLQLLSQKNESENVLNDMRAWYNGYRFSRKNVTVFSPYSVLLFLREDGFFDNYWFRTATPSFLINLLKEKHYNLKDLDKPSALIEDLDSFEIDKISLKTLFFQTGYLTIKDYNEKTRQFSLNYPNNEVRQSFLQSIVTAHSSYDNNAAVTYAHKLSQHLTHRDIHSFLMTLQKFFREIPYTAAVKNEYTLQMLIYALCFLMGIDVKVEVATRLGRIDLTLTTAQDIFILELKYDGSAQEAIDQIKDRKYYQQYTDSDKTITLVGVSFDSEQRTLADGWIIEKAPL